MRFRPVLAGWAMLGLLAAGCSQQPSAPPSAAGTNQPSAAPAAPVRGPAAGINQAQPKLQTIKLYLGPRELDAELAMNDQQRMAGMMFRANLAESEGMLFVFPVPHRTGFWMKNVTVPLSAAYIDPEGTILEIHKLEPGNTNAVEATSDRIQYVLETAEGWFTRNGVSTGTVIRTDRGSFAETFIWRR